jgi:hypothetical protein
MWQLNKPITGYSVEYRRNSINLKRWCFLGYALGTMGVFVAGMEIK